MKKNQEVILEEGKLNQVILHIQKRANGSTRIQQDFKFCPTMAEQHSALETDLNYLIEKYKPDELAAYIAAKSVRRPEIIGHDFSREPSLQDAKNIIYKMKQNFEKLPDEIRNHFRSHVDFLKFIDNPENQQKLIDLGLMKQEEITKHLIPTTTPTQETKESKSTVPESSSKS